MTIEDRGQVTILLDAASDGDDGAAESLWLAVNDEIRQMAAAKLAHERSTPSLQATMVVNEIYLRMWPKDGDPPRWEDRRHFFGSVARVMGQFLIDHARTRGRLKRGGDRRHVSLDVSEGELADLTLVDAESGSAVIRALQQLETHSPRQAEVAWLRYVAGLTVEQTSRALEISPRTVNNDWQYAQAWLRRELSRESEA
ncbi:MAG: ECF-type sigma factor [Phycisphaerales bacterium]|nr:ECF-type sigma factor [Phycisphaerales bacterium]